MSEENSVEENIVQVINDFKTIVDGIGDSIDETVILERVFRPPTPAPQVVSSLKAMMEGIDKSFTQAVFSNVLKSVLSATEHPLANQTESTGVTPPSAQEQNKESSQEPNTQNQEVTEELDDEQEDEDKDDGEGDQEEDEDNEEDIGDEGEEGDEGDQEEDEGDDDNTENAEVEEQSSDDETDHSSEEGQELKSGLRPYVYLLTYNGKPCCYCDTIKEAKLWIEKEISSKYFNFSDMSYRFSNYKNGIKVFKRHKYYIIQQETLESVYEFNLIKYCDF